MLTNFCGFRLNTAGVIIGWVGAVLSFFTIVLLSIVLAYFAEIVDAAAEGLNNYNLNLETLSYIALIILCVYITINAINLISSALLIIGTIKERHLLLVPWLLNSGLSLFSDAIHVILMMGISIAAPFGGIAFPLMFSGLIFVFHFYIWYAIYSLFKQIQATPNLQQRLNLETFSSPPPPYIKI